MNMKTLTATHMQSLINVHGDNMMLFTCFAGMIPCGNVKISEHDGFTHIGLDYFTRKGKRFDCVRYNAKSGGYILIPLSIAKKENEKAVRLASPY